MEINLSGPKYRRALTPNVVRLGLVSFFADISSEMLYPITPIFLTLVLGASAFDIGLIEGFAEGVASLLKTYSGRWSDRLQKRRTFVWVGYLCAALAKPLVGAAASWPQVLFARSFDRFGKGIRSSPRDALLAESVAPEFRGAAFGWHRMMDTAGAAIGPLLAILFLHYHSDTSGLRGLYYWALIPGLISVLIVFAVRERKPETATAPIASKRSDDQTILNFRNVSAEFKKFLFGWGVFSLANSSDVFLLLKAQQNGISLTLTIFMYALYNLIYSLLSPYLGHLSDRFGRKWVLISGLGVFMFVYLLFGFANQPWQFWSLFAIYGAYMAATDGVGKALAIDLVPKDQKATGVGLLGTVTGLATIFASASAGLIWDKLGSQWTFIYGAIGALIAISILATLNSPRALK